EGAFEDDGRAFPPGEQRLDVPAADVELGQHLQDDVLGADPGREVEAEVRPEAVRMREQRTLRLPGRPGGVDQEQGIRVCNGRVLMPGTGAWLDETLCSRPGRFGQSCAGAVDEEERGLGVLELV